MTDVAFAVSADFDRRLIWARGGSVRYLVARVTAHGLAADAPAERKPLNIALVVDASGSMGGGKLEAAKQAALGLIEQLTANDRLTLVSFASDVQVHLDAVPVHADNRRTICDAVSGLVTRGMTNLSGGWFAGVDCAARIAEADPQMTARVIILSDGCANEGITDPAELGEHAGELRSRGVLTSTLGIGDGYDEQLLRGIAESGGGRLHDAEHFEDIRNVLLGELAGIVSSVVEDAVVELVLPVGVRALALGRRAGRTDFRVRLPLGPIMNGVERIAVFKLICPASAINGKLRFELEASGRVAGGDGRIDAVPVGLCLTAVGGVENNEQARDDEAAVIVARAWHADIVSQAARMNRDGDFDRAIDFVRRAKHYFSRYVEGLPECQDLADELALLGRNIGRRMSSRVHKEMVLSANMVMDSRVDFRMEPSVGWQHRLARGE